MKRFLMNMRWKVKRRVDALVIWFPLMTKKQHRILLSRERQQHQRDLEEANKKIDSILDRAGRIEWRKDGDSYAMLLRLEPRMFGAGYCSSDELKYLAKAFAYRVEAEIATARFIQSAYQLEQDKYRNTR